METKIAASYNDVAYPSAIYAQTHPGSVGVIARLAGLQTAPVERCRVLELGCGDGCNLLSMAYGLPGSEFVGADLADIPVARGQAMIARLGLKNISLLARDVAEIGDDFGQFDYIIAHGLYSWTPPSVRERVLQICSRNLSKNGVAYVSYNAYPGNHLRDLVRGMMRYHAAHFSSPQEQMNQARGLIKLLSEAGDPNDPYLQILQRESERMKKYATTSFFHDDLNFINQPFYFHEFMTNAGKNGLQYLGEADLPEKRTFTYPAHIQAVLDGLDPADIIGGEQYRDFLRCRAFRQTLLCHEGIPLERGINPDAVRDLFVAGNVRPASGKIDVRSETVEVFRGPKESEFETNRPLMKAAFSRMAEAWPQFTHFPDLLSQIRTDLGENKAGDADNLAMALLQAAIANGLELRTYQPGFVTEISEKPTVSALARVQVEASDRVSNLLHGVVELKDDLSRLLLRLLDGTRDRPALLASLQNALDAGEVTAPVSAPLSAADLEVQLKSLVRMALLVA